MGKWIWVNIDTGELIKKDERHLKECPKCGKELHSNKHKDLETVSFRNQDRDISICIDMYFCESCHGLYISQDY